MARLPFYGACADWPNRELHVLDFLIENGEPLDRPQFALRVDDTQAVLPPDWDQSVRYFELSGYAVVWYVHSATKYVFAEEQTIVELASKIDDPRVERNTDARRYYELPDNVGGTVFDPTDPTFGPIMAALQAGEFETARELVDTLVKRTAAA